MSPNTITSSERIPTFVLKATAAASLGGILFGYDMGVISAALPQLIETFNLGEGQQEMVVSFLYIGCFIGASVGGFLCDKHGRKRMIIVTDVVFIVGATVLYAASTFRTVLFGRIIIGCAVAISGIADVAYLHEISPRQYRGAIVSCNEACISLGFLISYLVGYFVSLYIPNDGWRDMFAFGSIIAALQLIGMIMMPESPVWLEQNGEIDAAEVVLNQIYGTRARASTSTSNEEVESNDTNKGDTEPYSSLTIEHPLPQIENTPRNFSMQTIRTFYRQIIIAVFLCTMQSWCGHTNILNFAPEIFAQFGFNSEKQVLICTLLVGVVKFGTVCFAIMKVESYGRRYLLLLGMSIIAICLLILSISFALIGDTNEMSTIGKISSTAAVFGVAGGYSLSFGPLVWLITSEIFPSNIRGRALGMSSICSYVAAYLVSYTFFTGKGFALIFATYFLLTFMSIIFTYVSIPDTTKKTAEEIHADLGRLWGAKYGTISA